MVEIVIVIATLVVIVVVVMQLNYKNDLSHLYSVSQFIPFYFTHYIICTISL